MSQGKRYGREEKKEILQFRQNHTYFETSQKYGVSEMTLARWSRKLKDKDSKEEHISGDEKYLPLIRVLKYLEGVKAAAFVNEEGMVVASLMIGGESEDILVRITAALLAAADRTSEELDIGNLETIIIKSSEGICLIRGTGPSMCLTILFDENMDLSRIVTQAFPFIERISRDIIALANPRVS